MNALQSNSQAVETWTPQRSWKSICSPWKIPMNHRSHNRHICKRQRKLSKLLYNPPVTVIRNNHNIIPRFSSRITIYNNSIVQSLDSETNERNGSHSFTANTSVTITITSMTTTSKAHVLKCAHPFKGIIDQ